MRNNSVSRARHRTNYVIFNKENKIIEATFCCEKEMQLSNEAGTWFKTIEHFVNFMTLIEVLKQINPLQADIIYFRVLTIQIEALKNAKDFLMVSDLYGKQIEIAQGLDVILSKTNTPASERACYAAEARKELLKEQEKAAYQANVEWVAICTIISREVVVYNQSAGNKEIKLSAELSNKISKQLFRAQVYFHLLDHDNAITHCTMALKLAFPIPITLAYFWRGITYFKLGQFRKAYHDLIEVIKLDGSKANFFRNPEIRVVLRSVFTCIQALEPNKPIDGVTDYMVLANQFRVQGDELKKTNDSQAEQSYKHAILFYTQELFEYDADLVLSMPTDSRLGLVFYNRALAYKNINQSHEAFNDLILAKLIFNLQIAIAEIKPAPDDKILLKIDLDRCNKELQNFPKPTLPEEKNEITTVKKKKKKKKKNSPDTIQSEQKFELKKQEDALKKQIKKLKFEEEKQRVAKLKEEEAKKAKAQALMEAKKMAEEKEKEDKAALIFKEKAAKEQLMLIEKNRIKAQREQRRLLKEEKIRRIHFNSVLEELKITVSKKQLEKEKARDEAFNFLLNDLLSEEISSIINLSLNEIKAQAEEKIRQQAKNHADQFLQEEEKQLSSFPKETSQKLKEYITKAKKITYHTNGWENRKINAEKITEKKCPFDQYLQKKAGKPIKLALPSKAIEQLQKLPKEATPFKWIVGGLIRDTQLGRPYGQHYKDKKEGDIDLLISPTPFEKIQRVFPKAIRISLNTHQELTNLNKVPEFYLYDISDANKYKHPFNEDGSYKDIFDDTQIKESPYFNFEDPLRAEMLSRDLEINCGFADENGFLYALPETMFALNHRLISIPNKLELLHMEAKVTNKKLDETVWAGKTNEEIAYKIDIRIFLRAMLALSHGDLVLSQAVANSIPHGLAILENNLYTNPISVKQINTLLQTKVFRHSYAMAIRRFQIFTDCGINQILFPGLIEKIQLHHLEKQLEEILIKESKLERIYAGFLALQYNDAFQALSEEQWRNPIFICSFINKLIGNKPLIASYFDSFLKRQADNFNYLINTIRQFTRYYNAWFAPCLPQYPGSTLFSKPDDKKVCNLGLNKRQVFGC